jgi:hypothetical protein
MNLQDRLQIAHNLALEGAKQMISTILAHPPAALVLRQSPIPALRKLSVEESHTGVVITGRVSSYYLKQLAQEAVMPLLDHRELLNRVMVVLD